MNLDIAGCRLAAEAMRIAAKAREEACRRWIRAGAHELSLEAQVMRQQAKTLHAMADALERGETLAAP